MSELTLHTGAAGDQTTLHVAWFDHNNIRQETVLEIRMLKQDKPRTLEIRIAGAVVAQIQSGGRWVGP